MWGRKKRRILKHGELSPEIEARRYSEGFLRAVGPLGFEEGLDWREMPRSNEKYKNKVICVSKDTLY